MNGRVKIPGKTLYGPNFRDTAVLENVQSRFNFPYIRLYFFFPPTCIQMYEKLKTRLKAF